MTGKLGLVALFLFFLVACEKQVQPPIKSSNVADNSVDEKVVYGADDRLDLFEILDPHWLMVAGSTVALVNQSKVSTQNDGYKINGREYGSSYSLCQDEPFYSQPTAAFCSGSLIAPDIIVTAGHCLRNQKDCQDTKFVFNFGLLAADHDPSVVGLDDVYGCAELIHSEVQGVRGSDFAIVRLDRQVVGHDPLPVRHADQIDNNTEILVIGHPAGLPTKLAAGAAVRENNDPNYFVANLDTYGGNSGSAVLNVNTSEIEGILVRGDTDYIFQGGCRKSNVCPDTGCRGEDVTRITKIFDHISIDDLNSSDSKTNEKN